MSSQPSPAPSCQWFSTVDGNAHVWRQAAVQPAAVTVHLNLQGSAELLWQDSAPMQLLPGELLWVRGHPDQASCRRVPGASVHECLVLCFPDAWLRSILAGSETGILPALAPLLLGSPALPLSHRHPLTQEDQEWARLTAGMKSAGQARHLLEGARLMEFLMREAFGNGNNDAGLSRSDRLGRERVKRVKKVLLERLAAPPDLQELAEVAGCTASYLSRSFTRAEGMTLSIWLRHARIEKAAGLIAAGFCNVSEAAAKVGYRSLSHFSRAFHAEKGIPPSRYVQHLSGTGPAAH